MAETDLIPYLLVVVVGSILAIILSELRRLQKHKQKSEQGEIEKGRSYSEKEKHNFKKGFVIGIITGFLVYIQHIFGILGLESPWYFPFIQIYPITFYLTISFVYAGFKILMVFTKLSLFEKKFGYADGIFVAFAVIQAIVFFRYPSESVPILEGK